MKIDKCCDSKLNKSNLEGLFLEGFLGLRFGGLIFFSGGGGRGEDWVYFYSIVW